MTNFSAAMSLCNARLPLVPMLVTSKGASWRGKWSLNANTDYIKSIGGPWNSQDDAVAAVLATGQYRLRAGTKLPHLDAIA